MCIRDREKEKKEKEEKEQKEKDKQARKEARAQEKLAREEASQQQSAKDQMRNALAHSRRCGWDEDEYVAVVDHAARQWRNPSIVFSDDEDSEDGADANGEAAAEAAADIRLVDFGTACPVRRTPSGERIVSQRRRRSRSGSPKRRRSRSSSPYTSDDEPDDVATTAGALAA